MNTQKGSFTISLDFELFWGVRDKRTTDSYKNNLEGTVEVIPKLLDIFKQYNIHVTWATVGLLLNENIEKLKENIPQEIPDYENELLNPYGYIEELSDAKNLQQYHCARNIIENIMQVKNQEIGTHTYSHFYCLEKNRNKNSFDEDLNKAIEISSELDLTIDSIVFPRNQVNNQFISILQEKGIKIFRGNPTHWAYREGEINKSLFQRIFRFVDTYVNISGNHISEPLTTLTVTECKSSMFLRPYSQKLNLLEKLKINRIKNAMTQAAKENKNFHLWWHPHNFGINQTQNLQNLHNILLHYKYLNERYGMKSLNMRELITNG